MDYDEYKRYLQEVKNSHGKNIGINWNVPNLRPLYHSGELVGWKLAWAGPFEADEFYVCVREDWAATEHGFERTYFSFHFGPYFGKENLEDARWKAVIVRIDSDDYDGRGFHIHDSRKKRRIHQAELLHPQLAEFQIATFIDCVVQLRQGKSVTDAFDLRFAE
jgi:hypothetical protein